MGRTSGALKDAEGFLGIVMAVEGLGRFLERENIGKRKIVGTMAQVRDSIVALVQGAPLMRATEVSLHRVHTPFRAAYDIVRRGRNSAVHEGAFARHLATKSLELALVVEDALMVDEPLISDFMVHGVVTASPWQPLSFVRQTMLANAFSFLPVWMPDPVEKGWRLVSDFSLATYLRTSDPTSRHERLVEPLQSAAASGALRLEKPFVCSPEASAQEVLRESRGLPILIRGDEEQELIGIATPYDLL